MPTLLRHITLSSRQFGYREFTSCSNTKTILKEVIYNYNSSGSHVFCGVLDMSKAFDRVDFSILGSKLAKTSVPFSVTKNIDYMLRNSYVKTMYNGACSGEWKLQRGLRQGGVLSAFLFSFYIDDMLKSVCSLKVGCCLSYSKVNILS